MAALLVPFKRSLMTPFNHDLRVSTTKPGMGSKKFRSINRGNFKCNIKPSNSINIKFTNSGIGNLSINLKGKDPKDVFVNPKDIFVEKDKKNSDDKNKKNDVFVEEDEKNSDDKNKKNSDDQKKMNSDDQKKMNSEDEGNKRQKVRDLLLDLLQLLIRSLTWKPKTIPKPPTTPSRVSIVKSYPPSPPKYSVNWRNLKDRNKYLNMVRTSPDSSSLYEYEDEDEDEDDEDEGSFEDEDDT